MDEMDITCFLKWRYQMFLAANIRSVAKALEDISKGDTHSSKKQLNNDVSDMRKYKKVIQNIIDISNGSLKEIDELIKVADQYRQ